MNTEDNQAAVIDKEGIATKTVAELEKIMKTCSTELVTACLGKLCNQHASCARWHAVVTGGPDHPRQATCMDAEGKRLMFLAVEGGK